MITKEYTDAKIAEIRAMKSIEMSRDLKQIRIDELLTEEADQLTRGNNIAIIQAVIFGMCLLGFLAVL